MDVSKIKLGTETYNIKDSNISAWARAAAKPTYTASEVGALPDTTTIPTKTSDLTNDSGFINKVLYYGTCATAAASMPKVCTVETFPTFTDNGITHAKDGTIIAVKFTYSDTNTEDAPALNVNGIGAKSIMYNNAIITSTAKNTTVAGTAKMLAYYRYNTSLDSGDGAWEYLGKSVDSNSTYSVLSESDLNTGTATTGRLVSAKLLRDNFYTEDEVDTLLNAKQGTLTFDSTPTENSTNPVTSGGIYTALDGFANNMSSVFQENLVSGTNIKTVNGQSLLASGNIDTSELIFGYLSSGNFYIYSGQSAIQVTPNQEFLYIDTIANKVYRYNGTSYVETGEQVNANWNETNTSSKAYIQNKPNLLDVSYSNNTAYFVNSSNPTTVPTNYYTKSEIDTKIGNIETLLASI